MDCGGRVADDADNGGVRINISLLFYSFVFCVRVTRLKVSSVYL